MNTTERRTQRVEIRAAEDTPGMFEAVVVNYGVVDSYNTVFDAGCFTDSLEQRLPRICWGHNWEDPIGRYVDYKDTADSLTLVGQLDDFDAVPRARQAYAQLRSGTIDQFSVGFHRVSDGTREDEDGRTHFTRAVLDEASLVLSGAVPGTKLVSVRSGRTKQRREIPEDLLLMLAEKLAAGDITKEAAQYAVDLAAGVPLLDGSDPAPTPTDPTPAVATVSVDDSELLAAAELLA